MVISSFIEPYSKNCIWDEGLKSVMRDVLQGLQVGRASIWIWEWRLTFTLTMNNSVFGLCQLVWGHGLRKVNSKGKNSAATTNSKSKSKNETLASRPPRVPRRGGGESLVKSKPEKQSQNHRALEEYSYRNQDGVDPLDSEL